jgi:hypothetical protein
MQKLPGSTNVCIFSDEHEGVTSFQTQICRGAVNYPFLADYAHDATSGHNPKIELG